MPTDKKTIGVTASNAATLELLTAEGKFEDQLDAAKFAMAYAVRQGVGEGIAEGASTKWNVGSFDSDRSLAVLLATMFPTCETPYRQIEFLINRGLQDLQLQIDESGRFDPRDFIE